MPFAVKKGYKLSPNAWMTTYTDLVTLLLTFFVMLLSMSVMKQDRRMAALNSVSGAFGVKTGGSSVLGDRRSTNHGPDSAPMKKVEADLQRLTSIELKNALESDMTIVREEERIIITLSDRVLFKPGSSRIDEGRMEFLTDLREVLKESLPKIELRGYAAPSETVLESDPFRAAVTLSTRRVFGLFHFLSEKGEIPPERIVAHGFGSRAEARGSLKAQHELGRQVQVILDYREKIPYRLRQPKRDSFLDFKGFIFSLPGGQGGTQSH
ncbi:MAG: flagellar motor protein MotB [Thermodesulfobacteriota bacterium]